MLQQHPNLCGILSVWGPQAAGAAQAIKAAGKADKTKIYVASDGQPADCDLLEQGGFYRNLSYRADTQGEAIADAVHWPAAERRQAGHQAHRLLYRAGLGQQQGRSRLLLHRSQGREVTQAAARAFRAGGLLAAAGRSGAAGYGARHARIASALKRNFLMKSLLRFWHRNSPQLFLGELLEKRWMEPIIPFTLTIAVFLCFRRRRFRIIRRWGTCGS